MYGFYPNYDGLFDEIERAVTERLMTSYAMMYPSPYPPSYAPYSPYEDFFVGWSQPPHPIDVIPSVNSSDSVKQQSRDVLYDYFHDDDLRSWVDNADVKHAFGIEEKEDYDPTQLIAAYENPNDPIWHGGSGSQHASKHASKHATGDDHGTQHGEQHGEQHGSHMSWDLMHNAVERARAKRLKLGPLPKSTYETHPGPVVIYYYDNDRMKKIVYPSADIPEAMKSSSDHYWWKHGAITTAESQDPKAIAAERANPGSPGGGKWGNEGFSWDKDGPGNVQSIVSGIMQIIGAVISVIPGIGTAVGTIIGVAGTLLAQIAGVIDDAFQGNDSAAAWAGIAQMLLHVATTGLSKGAGITIPPAAVQALGTTIQAIAVDVAAAQQKRLNYQEMWTKIAAKAKSYGKLGDEEAHTIALLLGENAAGNVFIRGYDAGKLTDPPTIAAIGKIMQAMAVFTDPKVVNIFLLGAGLGYLTKVQQGGTSGVVRSKGGPSTSPGIKGKPMSQQTKQAHSASGEFAGQIILADANAARDHLAAFVHWELNPRYGLNEATHYAGSEEAGGQEVVGAGRCASGLMDNGRAAVVVLSTWLSSQPWISSVLMGVDVAVDGKGFLFIKVSVSQITDEILQRMPSQVCDVPLRVVTVSSSQSTRGHYLFASPPDYSALSRGCPQGSYWDPLDQTCKTSTSTSLPLPPPQWMRR